MGVLPDDCWFRQCFHVMHFVGPVPTGRINVHLAGRNRPYLWICPDRSGLLRRSLFIPLDFLSVSAYVSLILQEPSPELRFTFFRKHLL